MGKLRACEITGDLKRDTVVYGLAISRGIGLDGRAISTKQCLHSGVPCVHTYGSLVMLVFCSETGAQIELGGLGDALRADVASSEARAVCCPGIGRVSEHDSGAVGYH